MIEGHAGTMPDPVEGNGAKATPEAPAVLVVDDTDGNRYAVARLLRGAGMRVTEAANGGDALRLVRELPDLVVLDIKSTPRSSWPPPALS